MPPSRSVAWRKRSAARRESAELAFWEAARFMSSLAWRKRSSACWAACWRLSAACSADCWGLADDELPARRPPVRWIARRLKRSVALACLVGPAGPVDLVVPVDLAVGRFEQVVAP